MGAGVCVVRDVLSARAVRRGGFPGTDTEDTTGEIQPHPKVICVGFNYNPLATALEGI